MDGIPQIIPTSARAQLIADLADDAQICWPNRKFDAAFFLDSLLDANRVTAHDVACLLNGNKVTQERVQKMIYDDAVAFFTSDIRGIEFIDERMAEDERDREIETREAA